MATIYNDGETIVGGPGRDYVTTVANGVVVHGAGGDDWLSASLRWQLIEGVANTVELWGQNGDDRLHVAATLPAPETWDDFSTTSLLLDGGKGDDEIWAQLRSYGAPEEITASGGTGDDSIYITSVPDDRELGIASQFAANIDGGAGSDEIYVELHSALGRQSQFTDESRSDISGGGGSDEITSDLFASYGDATSEIDGGEGEDIISVSTTTGAIDMAGGGIARNEVDGGAGNDSITAIADSEYTAYNVISGGAGADVVAATAIAAAAMDDPEAVNQVKGGEGDDRLSAEASIHVFFPTEILARGSNEMYGEGGNDRISATITLGGDTVAEAHSELYGGEGDDRLSATGGDDNLLVGNQGADTLIGSEASDRLIGGQGDDYLRSRGGTDEFVFQSIRPGEQDRVADFTIGVDYLDLTLIDANAFRSGRQTFIVDGEDGTGRAWFEEDPDSTGTILYADNGRRVLEVVLVDGRGVHADDYGVNDFLGIL